MFAPICGFLSPTEFWKLHSYHDCYVLEVFLPTFTPEEPKKIIVISQNESQGYADFKKKISLSKDEFNELFELKSVARFKADLISDEIRKDLSKDNYQCICIVRGGGDQQQLHEFSKPNLLRAIHDAIKEGIPVIVAIGHANDKPLCYYVNGVYGADTPTDAGNAIKNYLSQNSKKKK